MCVCVCVCMCVIEILSEKYALIHLVKFKLNQYL